jgi:hypothetical protein
VRRRRGISTLALILSFGVIFSLIALAVDIGLLVQRQQQLKTAGEAAALAGALDLFDSPANQPAPQKLAAARAFTLRYAAANSFTPQPLQLDANLLNKPRGDIVLGSVDPLTLAGPFLPASEKTLGQVVNNAWLVRTRHSQAGGRGPILFFGSLVGVPSSDIYTESIAAVERRVVGYQPAGVAPIPMLPLLAESSLWQPRDLGLQSDGSPANQAPEGEGEAGSANSSSKASGQDRFFVDPSSGLVGSGSDGIPEIELVIKIGGQSSGGNSSGGDQKSPGQQAGGDFQLGRPIPSHVLQIGDSVQNSASQSAGSQILNGLWTQDLLAVGGQVVVGSQWTCLDGGPQATETDWQEIQAALHAIVGQPRLLMLGEVQSSGKPQKSPKTAKVVNFSAGVVVDSLLSEGSITIRIQPVVLNSCTALVSSGTNPNPWVGKILLVR